MQYAVRISYCILTCYTALENKMCVIFKHYKFINRTKVVGVHSVIKCTGFCKS